MILQQEAPYTAFDGSGGYEPPDPSPTLDQRETSVQTPVCPLPTPRTCRSIFWYPGLGPPAILQLHVRRVR